jgi:hypothetical protein
LLSCWKRTMKWSAYRTIIMAAVAKNRSWAGLPSGYRSSPTVPAPVPGPPGALAATAGVFSGHITITRSWAGSRRDAESSPMTCFAKGSTGTVS